MAIFDRFIAYAWTEKALELVLLKESPTAMKSWLIGQGLGIESARRTNNLLMHMWFKPDAVMEDLQNDALRLFRTVSISEHVALHWGVALVQFPLFRETAQVIGRLGILQGEFSKEEIINRVLAKYGNQSTIRRAIQRVIQTMTDWAVIQPSLNKNHRVNNACPISSPVLAEWVFRTVMACQPEKYWLIHDLVGALEIFPFAMKAHTSILYTSPYMNILRDSNGAEIVGIRDYKVEPV